MKKPLLILLLLIAVGKSYSQDLPFSRFLSMGPAELLQNKFKYNARKNQYVLSKEDFWAELLETTKTKNYSITMQYGALTLAHLRVEFTNTTAFHRIMDYVLENDIPFQETVSSRRVTIKFEADGYEVELYRYPVNRSKTYTTSLYDNDSSTALGLSYSRTLDISHENFVYIIRTGTEPDSPWHQKQERKRRKREDSGRKARSILDYM